VLCLPVWLIVMSAIYDVSWLVLQRTTLDSALNMGCRSGALVDPGRFDQYLADLASTAETSTWSSYQDLGRGPCVGCTFSAEVVGTYPDRSLRCQVDRQIAPLVGLAFGSVSVSAVQVAHLEWQY